MRWLLVAAMIAVGQNSGVGPLSEHVDISTLKIGEPAIVTMVNLSKLKGVLRRIAWSPDASKLYIQTAEGDTPSATLHHYSTSVNGEGILSLQAEPDWAGQFWSFKSDRSAPGISSLMIDVEQTHENIKYGTGSAGAIEGGDRTGGNTVMGSGNIDRAGQQQKQSVVRLMLLGEIVSEFVNERPSPGLTFSWGPSGSGTIAYTTREGRLVLLDQQKRKRTISSARDALLPAWSLDGKRLAWVQKTARKQYALMCADIVFDR